eukprot:379661-Prymnesium_polylepis.3
MQAPFLVHYTYPLQLLLDGTPCEPWTLGEYSFDKRDFSLECPRSPLPTPPPNSAAATWLVAQLNAAMDALPGWPRGRGTAQSVYGRRRRLDFATADTLCASVRGGVRCEEDARCASRLMVELINSSWDCQGSSRRGSLRLDGAGAAIGVVGLATWGVLSDPTLGEHCPVGRCLFVDAGRKQHNARLEGDGADLGAQRLRLMPHRLPDEMQRFAQTMS